MSPSRVLPVLALLLGAAACGGSADPAPAPDLGAAVSSAAAGAQSDGGAIDACALLKPAEIKEVLGTTPPAEAQMGRRWCSWTDPAESTSVTVRIGSPGSAPGGALPAQSELGPTEPGPDGTRYASGNTVEFAHGDRLCDVQVVTSVTDDSDRPATDKLVALVRDRL